MNNVTYPPTLCVGADVHLDEIVLRAVDKGLGHEVVDRFHVTNNLPGAQQAAATIAAAATELGYTRIEIACEATGMLWVAPEPATLGLLALGTLAHRRRRRA